jgi:two-component system OmpR family response regulator
MSAEPHVLIVDDARDIREPLGQYLRRHGFRTGLAGNALEARAAVEGGAIDLVILDVMMPGEDGLSVCRWLVARGGPPVILLTAMSDDTDRIVGLELGADDYVVKPFNPRELLARVRAVLRRANSLPQQRAQVDAETLSFDRWQLNVARRELIGEDGVAIPLSTAEFLLLSALLAHPRMVLSRDQLLDLTRGRSAAMFDRSIDNQVSRLRKKVEANPKAPALIKTVWGGGYMLTAEVARA